jgi:Mlc titration factor MtfA (ptsG expression regulator)
MQILLAEKHFEGCGGIALTDEMKVTIAAQAAILLLGHPKPTYFPKAISILVYPSTYVVQETTRDGFIETKGQSVRLGESWVRGVVVLAWDQVQRHAGTVGSGHNVVLHEFAHQLDQESGPGTGTPHLASRASYAEWARVMSREYEALRDKALHHLGDVMDSYGATNPAEFFAVATETFFTNPHALKRTHTELYEELKDYYRLDPASWMDTA